MRVGEFLMIYLSGIHALNLNCNLLTCGDWHQSALKWEKLTLLDSKDSIFENYGIEYNKQIPKTNKKYPVANHIRALLDLLVLGYFPLAEGMKEDFICNEEYTNEIFDKVYLMKSLPNWNEIDKFMEKEYRLEWLEYKEGKKS